MRKLSTLLVLVSIALVAIGVYSDSQTPLDIGRVLFCTAIIGWLTILFNDVATDLRLSAKF